MSDKYRHVQPDEYGEYDWSWQEDPDSKAEDLPEKKAYTSIKKFQSYELTQCVSYEMAIRNPKYKKEVDFVMESYKQNQVSIDSYIENHQLESLHNDEEGYRDTKKDDQSVQNSDIEGFYYKNDVKYYKFTSAFKDMQKFKKILLLIENIETVPFNYMDNYIEREETEIYGEEFYVFLHKIMKSFHKNKQKQKRITNSILHKEHGRHNESSLDIIKNFYSNRKIEQSSVIFDENNNNLELVDIKEHESCYVISQYNTRVLRVSSDFSSIDDLDIKQNMDKIFENLGKKGKYKSTGFSYSDKMESEISIVEKFKRPKLRLHSYVKKNIIAQIDISRPKKEIIEYIEYLKNTLYDSKVLSIYELIESSVESIMEDKEDTEIVKDKNLRAVDKDKYLYSAKIFSEMFFVWDYINVKLRNNKKYNEILKENRDIQIIIINKNAKQNNSLDRTSNIKKAKEHYTTNKKTLDIKKICMDKKSINKIGLKGKTIHDRYTAINPFIIEEKYRELMNENRK